MAATDGMTDHDQVVGRIGIEARRLSTIQKTPDQDLACKTDCPVVVNALGVRRWIKPNYAWSAGLALATGGGSTKTLAQKYTWDTYFGIGPTVGATFLLANWKHMAIGVSPQLDLLYFVPGGSAEKPRTLNLNLRGLVEAEIHLGFIGLPQLSLGLASGLEINYRRVSRPEKSPPDFTGSRWSAELSGPRSLLGLVTDLHLRFYL
jgi:hypothetical protein